MSSPPIIVDVERVEDKVVMSFSYPKWPEKPEVNTIGVEKRDNGGTSSYCVLKAKEEGWDHQIGGKWVYGTAIDGFTLTPSACPNLVPGNYVVFVLGVGDGDRDFEYLGDGQIRLGEAR